MTARRHPGGTRRSFVALTGPLSRSCPACGSKPGWRCVNIRRMVGAPMVHVHPERRKGERSA